MTELKIIQFLVQAQKESHVKMYISKQTLDFWKHLTCNEL